MHMSRGICRGQTMVPEPLELDLQTVVNSGLLQDQYMLLATDSSLLSSGFLINM